MSHLARRLGATFLPKPEKQRQPDRHRKARERAQVVAKQFGIKVEREGSGLVVWPPASIPDGADAYGGDHGCQDWSEAAEAVDHYVTLLAPPDEGRIIDQRSQEVPFRFVERSDGRPGWVCELAPHVPGQWTAMGCGGSSKSDALCSALSAWNKYDQGL